MENLEKLVEEMKADRRKREDLEKAFEPIWQPKSTTETSPDVTKSP